MITSPTQLEFEASYIGRFAPSSTGPLHLGSLKVAIACALEAHQQRGSWFVRLDDIDTLRCSDTFSTTIAKTIQVFFKQQPAYLYRQSDNIAPYVASINTLIQKSLLYRCSCSRKDIAFWSATTKHLCREDLVALEEFERLLTSPLNQLPADQRPNLRFKSPIAMETTTEQIMQDLVIFRRDGCFSYHLSCVANDEADSVTHIIRGADLIEAEAPQRALIKALNFNQPVYDYLSLVRNQQGQKLSKQHHAPAIDASTPLETLVKGLQQLHWPDNMPHFLDEATLWHWAQAHWSPSANCVSSS